MSRTRAEVAAAGLLAAALLLGGCSSGPDGVSAHADDSEFRQCLEREGAPSAIDDLSEKEERRLLSYPGALTCVADELEAEERTEALGRVFPPDDDPNDEDRTERRAAIRGALVDYVRAQPEGVEETLVVQRLAALMQGFGWEGALWHSPRQQVAFAFVRHRWGAEDYEEWRVDHPLEDDPSTWSDYVEAERESPTGQRTWQLAEAIEEAQDDL